MTSDNTCIIGCLQLKNENPMCEHPVHQVNVSRIGVLCAPDSGKFFGTPCILDKTRVYTIVFNSAMGYGILSNGYHRIRKQQMSLG